MNKIINISTTNVESCSNYASFTLLKWPNLKFYQDARGFSDYKTLHYKELDIAKE